MSSAGTGDNEVELILKQNERLCNTLAENYIYEQLDNYCGLVFDGILCWLPTKAGLVAEQPCSGDVLKSTLNGVATRQCDETGRWHIPNNYSQSWTNYSQCGTFYIEKTLPSPIYSLWIPIIKYITNFGNVVSGISLILALFIFAKLKKLYCPRNTLHINLFLSFLMRASMSLLKDVLFVKGTALKADIEYADGKPLFLKDNYSWICKAITSFRHYFIIANYMFLLMEGAYLHNLMFTNIFADNGVGIYCSLGWGLPLLFVIPWALLKIIRENTFCWTQKGHPIINLLIEIPIGITIAINFILFTIILKVLFGKLTSMYIKQRQIKYRKLLRSIMILVPLFGIPYSISLVLSFFVDLDQTLEILWLFFDQTFTAFQGLFASLIYCLMNSEVQAELKRKYMLIKTRNRTEFKRNRTISHTQQTSMPPFHEELHEIPNCLRNDDCLLKTTDFF